MPIYTEDSLIDITESITINGEYDIYESIIIENIDRNIIDKLRFNKHITVELENIHRINMVNHNCEFRLRNCSYCNINTNKILNVENCRHCTFNVRHNIQQISNCDYCSFLFEKSTIIAKNIIAEKCEFCYFQFYNSLLVILDKYANANNCVFKNVRSTLCENSLYNGENNVYIRDDRLVQNYFI